VSVEEGAERLRPACTSPATGPRFDVRFEPEGGLLGLARPLRVGPATVEALSLSLGRVRFPLALVGGAQRFQTRRTVARAAKVRIDLRALGAACAAAGVSLRVVGVSARGELRIALRDGAGVVAFELALLADGADLCALLRAARTAVDGPAPAAARVLAALRPLGVSLDAAAGLLRLSCPLRMVLREAMAGHGWRVPDARALRLAAPVVDERELLIASATPSLRGAAGTLGELRELALREAARALAPTLEALESGDDAGACARRVRQAVGAGRDGDALAATFAVDAGDASAEAQLAALVVEADDHAAQALAASLALRVALRAGDVDAAASAARRVDAVEAAGELAADALREAARACDDARAGVRAELLARALDRAPQDASLAEEAMRALLAVGDRAAVERVGRRILAELPEPASRVAILVAAARGVTDDALASRLVALWDDALLLAPADVALLDVAARAHLGTGDAAKALLLLDRAADAAGAANDANEAASLLARAARLAADAGRHGAALERLTRASGLGPTDPAVLTVLAAAYEHAGAADAALDAYRRLLAAGPGRAQLDALVAAARQHLARHEAREARAFHDAARRLDPAHPSLAGLGAEVDAAVADGWLSSPGSLRAIDVFALAGVARDASDPAALVQSVLDGLAGAAPVAEASSLVAAGCTAAARLPPAEAAPLLRALAEAAARVCEHLADPSDLAALEPHATTPESRASLAQRLGQVLRGAGQGGAAARALARAGVVRRDAATLRAAIELAVRAEAWDDAATVVREALEVVGEGPARAYLAARAAEIAGKQRA
jgi:hypothetical protein